MVRSRNSPGLGKLPEPLGLTSSLSLKLADLKSLNMSESLELRPMDLRQSLELDLDMADRLIEARHGTSLKNVLWGLRGSVKTSVEADFPGDLSRLKKGLYVRGKMSSRAEAVLDPGHEAGIRLRLDTPGLHVRLEPGLTLSGLKSHLVLEKKYALRSESKRARRHGPRPMPGLLSVEVLRSEGRSVPDPFTRGRAALQEIRKGGLESSPPSALNHPSFKQDLSL